MIGFQKAGIGFATFAEPFPPNLLVVVKPRLNTDGNNGTDAERSQE
jgi:hypothetical protein